MAEGKRTKLNISLLAINIVFQSLTPLIAAYFVAYGILAQYWQENLNVVLVIGWCFYFIFVIIGNLRYFPTRPTKIAALFFCPLAFGLIATLRHGFWGGQNFIISTGSNIFVGIVVAAFVIIFFGAGLSANGKGNIMKEEGKYLRSEFKDLWPIALFMLPAFIMVIFFCVANSIQIFQNSRNGVTPLVDFGLWLVALGGTTSTYYRQLSRLSIFG